MVRDRDQRSLDFIERFKVVTSSQVNRIEYSNLSVCCRRLKKMTDDKLIFRRRNPYGVGFVYSWVPIKSFKQLGHKIARTDFYLKLSEITEIRDVLVEQEYPGVKPDLVLTCKCKEGYRILLIEIETSNNTINTQKYNNFLLRQYKEHFNAMPLVVYVTNKRVNNARFNYVKIEPDMKNIADVLK